MLFECLTIKSLILQKMETYRKMNKKNLLLIINIFLLIGTISAQDINYVKKEKVVLDTIFRLGGKPIICDIKQIKVYSIDYKFPNDPNKYSIDKNLVQKTVDRYGKIENFNRPAFEEVDESSPDAILVTENKEDVSRMYSYGNIQALSSPNAKNKKNAINTATTTLRKNAARKGGNIVLITKKEPRGGYGEPPSYLIYGEVFGYNPPPDEKKVDDEKEVLDEVLK